MKVSVRVRGEWFSVPCLNPDKTSIKWLGIETLKKYKKLRLNSFNKNFQDYENYDDYIVELRKTRGGAVLDPDDIISHVLDENDFVSLVLRTDNPNPAIGPTEIQFVPEQIPADYTENEEYFTLDGINLHTEDLMEIGKGRYKLQLSIEAEDRIIKSRNLLENILKENKVVYGINTGFGKFATTVIDKEDLELLQLNLIRSHAAGVGEPLPPERVRRLFALRINVLAKGYSGISPKTLKSILKIFNSNCLPWVPEKGTVGASGDLAPLAHLALGMLGEGKMWSPKSGWADASYVLEMHNIKPIKLYPKEGLALLNGTQLIASIGAEAVEKAASIVRQADVVAALSIDVLKGTTRAFDACIHQIRPHSGQILVAERIRALLNSNIHPSEIAESHRFCNKVQDAYTLRCCPQVHGVVHDTIKFVRDVINTELNSATDNPLVFAELSEILSGGNFHGEYPAKVLDYLTIAVHEIASMSERRIERLINPALSGLPAFLVENGGLNSGFMIAHCTAAALVSENKVLCHPASVDSLSTSAGTEDHVSMGGYSARKAIQVIENVEKVIAIELLAACQAIEFLRPLKTTEPLEKVYHLIRTIVKPWDNDRYMAPDIDAATNILRDGKIWETVSPHINKYLNDEYRSSVRPASPTTSHYSNENNNNDNNNNQNNITNNNNQNNINNFDNIMLSANKRAQLNGKH